MYARAIRLGLPFGYRYFIGTLSSIIGLSPPTLTLTIRPRGLLQDPNG